jgi:hypothetical protein
MDIISLGWAGVMTMFTFSLALVVWVDIMALVLQIFPFANAEIVTTAVTCIFMTLFGLSLGFALLKVQGE